MNHSLVPTSFDVDPHEDGEACGGREGRNVQGERPLAAPSLQPSGPPQGERPWQLPAFNPRVPLVSATGSDRRLLVPPHRCGERGLVIQQRWSFVLQESSWPGRRADRHIAVSECGLMDIFNSLGPSLR